VAHPLSVRSTASSCHPHRYSRRFSCPTPARIAEPDTFQDAEVRYSTHSHALRRDLLRTSNIGCRQCLGLASSSGPQKITFRRLRASRQSTTDFIILDDAPGVCRLRRRGGIQLERWPRPANHPDRTSLQMPDGVHSTIPELGTEFRGGRRAMPRRYPFYPMPPSQSCRPPRTTGCKGHDRFLLRWHRRTRPNDGSPPIGSGSRT
jgi:hypothetical protein